MTRAVFVSVLLLGLVPPVTAVEPKPESFDVLLALDARPVVVRLNVAVDGTPLGATWAKFVDALFAHLDTDKSGALEGRELPRLPQVLALLTVRGGFPAPPESPALTRDGLAGYLRMNGLGPLRFPAAVEPRTGGLRDIRNGTFVPTELLDRALIEALDTDKDGKLSPAEFAAAPAILAKLDTDENELLTPDEVLGRAGAAESPVPKTELLRVSRAFRFELLSARKADPLLAKRLLDRYGSKGKGGEPVPNRRLTRTDLNLSDEAFAALDKDGDGELDLEELGRFGSACVPDVELTFQLGNVAQDKLPAAVVAAGKTPVAATTTERGAETALAAPGVRLDFAPTSETFNSLGMYLNLFRQFDRDGNGYLDETEARNGVFRELFPLLDADGDGKVFEKELRDALAEFEPLAKLASAGLVSANVSGTGRGLFGLIDTNGDGQLSPRELRAVPKLAERFAQTKDGALGPGDLPRHFRVTFARTPVALWFAQRPDERPATPRPVVGPVWFQKMDRNRDGDVSRREFLGTEEDFRRIDLNGDGLIDAREAEAASASEER